MSDMFVIGDPPDVCTCWAFEGSYVYCTCMCSYCEEYCLPPEPDFEDGDDLPDDDDRCIHVSHTEQAGGFAICDYCGEDVTFEIFRDATAAGAEA